MKLLWLDVILEKSLCRELPPVQAQHKNLADIWKNEQNAIVKCIADNWLQNEGAQVAKRICYLIDKKAQETSAYYVYVFKR